MALLAGLLLRADPLAAQHRTPWRFEAFGDLAYLRDFNEPANHLFRSRGTAFRVNEWDLNMVGAYTRKAPSQGSRLGLELTVHAGKDAELFGFSATAPDLGGSRWLRHLGPTNVSYLAPVGRGLTLQTGIFGSVIGYDSLYAKDNLNYTRPWGADFTPYLMLGLNASYPFGDRLTGTLVLVNGYWHLAHANNTPSVGTQLAWKAAPRTTLKQTLLVGPHQQHTSLALWRFVSDSIAEWKAERATIAFEYQAATERVDTAGRPRAWWMSAQLPARWNVRGGFSVAARPEIAWDSHGRWTLARQTVKALTTTLEYRVSHHRTTGRLRLEYRLDDSRGPDGGFFADDLRLVPRQQLLSFGLLLGFDGAPAAAKQE